MNVWRDEEAVVGMNSGMRRLRRWAGAWIAVLGIAGWIGCAQAEDYPTPKIRKVKA
jgi:hypothetical protein